MRKYRLALSEADGATVHTTCTGQDPTKWQLASTASFPALDRELSVTVAPTETVLQSREALVGLITIGFGVLSAGVLAWFVRRLAIGARALHESRAQFGELADHMEDVFWLGPADVSNKIVYVSPAFASIWGDSPAHLLSNPDLRIKSIHEEDRSRVRRAYQSVLEGDSCDETYRIVRPDGDLRWIHERVFPVTDDKGNVVRMAGVARDISKEVNLERRLRRAQKLEAIGSLAGGIAHDFNNILQALLGFCKIAQESKYDDEKLLADCLHEIQVGGERAADLVAQLLTFSRAEETHREPINLGPIVNEALRLLKSSLPANIQIQNHVSDQCNPVFANHTQIHQIVLNLCTNAGQAMEKSGGTLRIELENLSVNQNLVASTGELPSGDYVVLSVADSGQGVDADDLDQIFDPFFTMKELGQGTGLGLATVHGIVHSMGGVIDVLSERGEGAEFKVYFPKSSDSELGTRPRIQENEVHYRGTGHVLFVDDEAAIIKLADLALTMRGFTVHAFSNPAQAIQAFGDDPNGFSVVVTDLTMPTMTGIDFAQQIRALNDSIPILLLSGRVEDNITTSLQITEILRKPIDINDLVDAITRHASTTTM